VQVFSRFHRQVLLHQVLLSKLSEPTTSSLNGAQSFCATTSTKTAVLTRGRRPFSSPPSSCLGLQKVRNRGESFNSGGYRISGMTIDSVLRDTSGTSDRQEQRARENRCTHCVGSQRPRDRSFHRFTRPFSTCSGALKIHPRVYVKKYMRKRVYRYVRYYLEIPRRIAMPSLGIQLQARRVAEHIP